MLEFIFFEKTKTVKHSIKIFFYFMNSPVSVRLIRVRNDFIITNIKSS